MAKKTLTQRVAALEKKVGGKKSGGSKKKVSKKKGTKRKGKKRKAPAGATARIKKITTMAKAIRKKSPSKKWSTAMKEAGRKYKKKK